MNGVQQHELRLIAKQYIRWRTQPLLSVYVYSYWYNYFNWSTVHYY
jgi:hypothetical protein